jgi:hypothetical protein
MAQGLLSKAVRMNSLLQSEREIRPTPKLSHQVVWFFLHSLFAVAAWFALMLGGNALNPVGVPQWAILALSIVVPLILGFFVNALHQDDMGSIVWLLGITWFMIAALWILDMPTDANTCFHCTATEKLTRTFFSFPRPSGLIDDDGPFVATWPAAALVGYSIGAKMGLVKRK